MKLFFAIILLCVAFWSTLCYTFIEPTVESLYSLGVSSIIMMFLVAHQWRVDYIKDKKNKGL